MATRLPSIEQPVPSFVISRLLSGNVLIQVTPPYHRFVISLIFIRPSTSTVTRRAPVYTHTSSTPRMTPSSLEESEGKLKPPFKDVTAMNVRA